ncbi:MAG: enoyl-CoA hydratase/isomerase family protein [Promethearchaeota archaeon]|nr:MAG: enoyl-CoA hydratase/isomerase family protein [Candidatus Lokiarchaeota archaeon]
MPSNNLDFGDYIEFSVKKRFGIITLNRVHRANSFTIEQLRNLKKAIEHCQENEKIRGIILTNNGTSFSTGMDIGSDYINGSDHEAVKTLEGTAAEICTLLFNGKPAIAAVNGRCMGEGVVFTLCCDYRICVKESFFQMPEIFSGIFTGTGCMILMSKIIGIPWAKKMCMFAEKISSELALKINLIDKIAEDKEELMRIAMQKAKFLFTKNQTVINTMKLCSNHFLDKSYNDAYELEKIASDWFNYKDKDQFIKNFREKFN